MREGIEEPVQELGFEAELKSVSIGGGFMLACDIEGRGYAWGTNHRGQLGNGQTLHSGDPGIVKTLSELKVIKVAAGY